MWNNQSISSCYYSICHVHWFTRILIKFNQPNSCGYKIQSWEAGAISPKNYRCFRNRSLGALGNLPCAWTHPRMPGQRLTRGRKITCQSTDTVTPSTPRVRQEYLSDVTNNDPDCCRLSSSKIDHVNTYDDISLPQNDSSESHESDVPSVFRNPQPATSRFGANFPSCGDS